MDAGCANSRGGHRHVPANLPGNPLGGVRPYELGTLAVRRIFAIALCMAAFGATAALIGWAAPLSAPPEISQKLLAFAAQRDDTEVLFFGSSHVFRGIDPRSFDEGMRAAGHPVRSFNFALKGMRPHEANALLRHVLSLRPRQLRWVFIEWGTWDPWIPSANRFKQRAVFWHDRRETLSAIVGSWRSDRDLLDRFDLVATHALHFLHRALATGRGPDAVLAIGATAPAYETPDRFVVSRRGYNPYTDREFAQGPTAEHRRRYLADLPTISSDWQTLSGANQRSVDVAPARWSPLGVQIDDVRDAGAEPIYLIMPTSHAEPLAYSAAAEGLVPHLIGFNDPARYPDLYQPDARFDRNHLNQRGGRAFSLELARRFAEEVVVGRVPR
jgi:hypothetical protein